MSSRRRRPSSPAAPPLEDDDLLSEVLLRLPPQPSSLPRASAVCKRWRLLVSDPRFLRRFRIHHRRNPTLLGFFEVTCDQISFVPTMEPPNRVPRDSFSLQFDDGDKARFLVLGCRHGLMLIFHLSMNRLLVWDPVTADQHSLSVPPGFDRLIHGAVVRSAGDAHHFHFRVVMINTEKEQQHVRTIARVYSSETGTWGNLISAPIPSKASSSVRRFPDEIQTGSPGVLVGDSLYWLVAGSLLEFDLDRQSLAEIPVPPDMYALGNCIFSPMWADGGGLGCIFISNFSAQLWKRKTDCDGVASWVLGRTIEMDKLLSLNSARERFSFMIVGFAEENNVVLLRTQIGVFTVQLDSLEFKIFLQTNMLSCYRPFESVYTTGTFVGGHDEAELLHDT